MSREERPEPSEDDSPESLESELERRMSPLMRPTMLGRRALVDVALRVETGSSASRPNTERREASAMTAVTMRTSVRQILHIRS